MLKHPPSFASKLKERCSKRSHRDIKYGSIRYFGNTPSNKLYWDLATIMFNPIRLYDMFAIMLPDIQYALVVEELADEKTDTPAELHLERQPLYHIKTESPDFDLLTHYVMTEDTVFDLRQIENMSQKQILKLGDLLKVRYRNMHISLIEQQSLRQLKANLSSYGSANTAREALQKLVNMLEYAAPSQTGRNCSDLAGDQAFIGLAEFSDFRIV